MRQLAAVGVAFFIVGFALSGSPDSLRYIEFRDGSVLRLPLVDEEWKITLIRPNGAIDPVRVRSTELQSITLTSEAGFEKKLALLAKVQQLGSEFFREREKAFADLVNQGAAIRADLETCWQFAIDLETRARLRQILDRLPDATGSGPGSVRTFDLFTLKEPSWGHLGNDGIAVALDGKTHRIARKDLQGMSIAPPRGFIPPGSSAGSDLRRLGPGEFPAGCHYEWFEKAQDGRPLRIGENIEKLFINKGFTLSTSIATSFVSVNNFQVMGKSRGLSAATQSPLWEGEITVRFCQPGREHVPAGVTHFGCYIAAVMPNGTAMIAYDIQGRQLGTVLTQNNGHDFIGVVSAVPMHRIRFVPNVQLDRDYTLDDFMFTPPVTAEASHPHKFIAQLASGDRVLCDDVSFSKGRATLHGMPGGLPDRSLPVNELLRVNFPEKSSANQANGWFAELRDGSILFAAEQGKIRPRFDRKPNVFQETNHLVGIWSSDYPRMLPPAKENVAQMWNTSDKRWDQITDVRFTDEAVTWRRLGQEGSSPYQKLSPLWLAAPSESPAPGAWRIRTRLGEDLVFTQPEQFEGRLSRALNALWQSRPIRFTSTEITAIFQAAK